MAQWKPGADFFNSKPRAAQLREISLSITDRMRRIVHDPEVATDPTLKSELVREIDNLQNQLIELGVAPHMNVGRGEREYKADPVMTAEYLAGQLVAEFAEELGNESSGRPLVQEFNELHGGGSVENPAYMVTLNKTPEKLRHFMVDMQFVTSIRKILDAPKDKGIERKKF